MFISKGEKKIAIRQTWSACLLSSNRRQHCGSNGWSAGSRTGKPNLLISPEPIFLVKGNLIKANRILVLSPILWEPAFTRILHATALTLKCGVQHTKGVLTGANIIINGV